MRVTRRTVPVVRRVAILGIAAVAMMAGASCSGSGDAVSATTCAEAFHSLEAEVAATTEPAEAAVRQTYFLCSRDDWLAEAERYIERNPYPPSLVVLEGPEERLGQECDEQAEFASAPACGA